MLDGHGRGEAETVIKAIDYAIAKKVDVINLSIISVSGERLSERFHQALQRAHGAGIVIVAAAGNDASGADLKGGDLDFNPRYPVCYDGPQGEPWWIIGVAGVDENDRKTPFSDYGFKCVDLAAPGVNIKSALVFHPREPGFEKMFGGPWSGTSLAVPLVAGAAALIKSIRPDFGPKEIYDVLTKSVDNIDSQNPFYLHQLGAGRLNLERAVSMVEELYPKPPEPEYAREDLPKKARLFYNVYKGKLAIAKFDVDNDGQDEWLTAKPIKNTMIYIWTEKGNMKKKIKISGNFKNKIETLIKK